jgi:pimeloyl-ACP methyl ester carboxylesterase
METELGRFPAEVERPEPLKFAYPIVLLPGLFSPPRHLGVLLGYLATIGWEAYVPDLRAVLGRGSTPPVERLRFSDLVELAAEALDALGRDAIVAGHDVGGLAALKLAERSTVKAAVAFAPLVPGVRTALTSGWRNWLALRAGRPLPPPAGRTLLRLVSDADPSARARVAATVVPGPAAAALEIANGMIAFEPAARASPRLIIAGASDAFAPAEASARLADSLGAKFVALEGRGHWLISGRALERAIHDAQRFLVHALGQDLLLLYPEEWKE